MVVPEGPNRDGQDNGRTRSTTRCTRRTKHELITRGCLRGVRRLTSEFLEAAGDPCLFARCQSAVQGVRAGGQVAVHVGKDAVGHEIHTRSVCPGRNIHAELNAGTTRHA